MSSTKVAEAVHLRGREHGSRYDPLGQRSNLGGQSFNHRVSGFPEGNYQDTRKGVQVVEIFTHAQNAAFALHVAVKAFRDGSLRERLQENGARRVAHGTELRFAGGLAHEE
jgi:hypothetical protein